MIAHILLASLLFIAAIAGWGRLLIALVAPRQGPGWASAAMLGYALCAIIGGACELARCISPLLVQCLLGGGAAAAIAFAIHDAARRALLRPLVERWRHEYPALAIIGFCFLLCLVFLLGATRIALDQCDDELAYAAMPLKMLQTGSLGDDPFCTRRLESAYGGQSFIFALLLGQLPVPAMPLLEHGIARFLLAAAALEFACLAGLRPWRAAVVALLALWPMPELNNTTSMVSGAALLIALLGVLAHRRGYGRIILAGILIAGTCSLKHTYIPACAFLLAGWLALGADSTLRQRLRDVIAIGGIAALLIAPWMIDMWRHYQTPLYPLLGRGIHGTAYGLYGRPNEGFGLGELLAVAGGLLLHPFPLAALALGLSATTAGALRRHAWIAIAVAAAAIVLFAVLTAGTSSERYSYPTTVLALVAGAAAALDRPLPTAPALAGPSAIAMRTAVMLAAFLAVAAGGWKDFRRWSGLAAYTVRHLPASWPAPLHGESASGLQQAVPRGERILMRIAHPLSCDFTRNDLWLIDWPGGTSPPPGLDCQASPSAIASYLHQAGIRYVAYSYADESGYSRAAHAPELTDAHQPWLRNAARNALAFQDTLMALAHNHRHVFDDGYLFVLDLDQAPAAVERP